MITLLRGEEFREINMNPKLKLNYAISNYGRLVSFIDNIAKGNELKGGTLEGYKIFRFKYNIEGKIKNKQYFFYRLVAEYFIQKESEDQNFVLHLDYNKINDKVENLKWANQKQLTEHHSKNPAVIKAKQFIIEYNRKADGRKLTSTQVIRIKKMLQREDNKTRLTLIAKQFNVSTQQLWRIRTGENWGHIEV
jgi:hypothetical protein